jgi:hypothetical protein
VRSRQLPQCPEPTVMVDAPAAKVSFEWHCRRMREHMRGDYYGDELPKPCPDCYSLRITTERIPFHVAELSRSHDLVPVTDAADAA